jgi:hypothetical protein
MDLWGYALRTDDARPLTRLSAGAGPCGGCAELTRELAKRRSQGWSVDFAGLDVRRVGVSGRGPVVTSRSLVDIPESSSFTTDGTFRNTSPAHRGARFEVRMRLTPRGYRLLSFTVS